MSGVGFEADPHTHVPGELLFIKWTGVFRYARFYKSEAVSTTAHLTKYTQMKYTLIEFTYISSALRRWLVLSQMEHLRSPLGGSDGRKPARDTRESKAEVTDANLLATLTKLNLPK